MTISNLMDYMCDANSIYLEVQDCDKRIDVYTGEYCNFPYEYEYREIKGLDISSMVYEDYSNMAILEINI